MTSDADRAVGRIHAALDELVKDGATGQDLLTASLALLVTVWRLHYSQDYSVDQLLSLVRNTYSAALEAEVRRAARE